MPHLYKNLPLFLLGLLIPVTSLHSAQIASKDESKEEEKKEKKNLRNPSTFQKSAVAHAQEIAQGLQKGDLSQVLKGLQLLRTVKVHKVSNPKLVVDKLLDALTGKAIQWEAYALKRHIAQALRPFIHRMYQVAQKQHKLLHLQEKKKLLKKIDQALSSSMKRKPPAMDSALSLT